MNKREKIDYYIQVHLGNSMNAISGSCLRANGRIHEYELINEAECALFILLDMVHDRYSDDEIIEKLKELSPSLAEEESTNEHN